MVFMVWVAVIVFLLAVYYLKVYLRFSKYGLKYIAPVPFLGNLGPLALKRSHFADIVQKLYDAYPDERFLVRFDLMKPVIVIRDFDLIKKITVEDYEHFLDHRSMVDDTVDPLFGRSLLQLKGQEWKDMRSTMSSAFTGSKVRAMVPFMVDAADQVIKKLKNKLKEADTGYIEVDTKDLTTRYSNDVIASCGFGLKVDSHADVENEFYLHAKSTAHFSLRRILVYLGYTSCPRIMKKLNFKLLREEGNDFFKDLFANTILRREEKKIFRPDIINILMKARKGNVEQADKVQDKDADFSTVEESEVGRRTVKRVWSDNDLLAQAVFFFLASFETISTAICFLLYELAVNPHVQEKLVKEIKDNEANNQELNSHSIQKLKYLDMVTSEILRKWPTGIEIERMCTKPYNLGKSSNKSNTDYIVNKGDLIGIPVWCFHYDPIYFPDPERFDPERFSEQNRQNIKPYSYLPFGSGPRSCIASRFALCELKVMIYHLLLQFKVSPAEKTKVPVKLTQGSLLLSMEGGHWVRFTSRE